MRIPDGNFGTCGTAGHSGDTVRSGVALLNALESGADLVLRVGVGVWGQEVGDGVVAIDVCIVDREGTEVGQARGTDDKLFSCWGERSFVSLGRAGCHG